MNMNKFIEFILNTLNFIVNLSIGVLITVIVFYIGFVLWDNSMLQAGADTAEYEMYKPDESDSESFEELKALNSEVIGWITLNNTGIDYPVVQGQDNVKYINTNAKGEYSLSGAIFMDYRNSVNPINPVSILYGHDMSGGKMFGNLPKYEDKRYFNNHKSGTLFLDGNFYDLTVVAYILTDAYNSEIYNVSSDISKYKDVVKDSASVLNKGELLSSSNLLILSTCNSSVTNGRSVVVCSVNIKQ